MTGVSRDGIATREKLQSRQVCFRFPCRGPRGLKGPGGYAGRPTCQAKPHPFERNATGQRAARCTCSADWGAGTPDPVCRTVLSSAEREQDARPGQVTPLLVLRHFPRKGGRVVQENIRSRTGGALRPTTSAMLLSSGTWIRTTIQGFKVPCPTLRRYRSDGAQLRVVLRNTPELADLFHQELQTIVRTTSPTSGPEGAQRAVSSWTRSTTSRTAPGGV